MIDIENVVFTKVATAVRSAYSTTYPKLKVYGEDVTVPESFPCINIVEASNSVYTRSISMDNHENHASVVYEVSIYTNDKKKKQSAKTLASFVDTQFKTMGFTRSFSSQLSNADRSIYRIVMRYTGVVEAGITVGLNTVYRVYGR